MKMKQVMVIIDRIASGATQDELDSLVEARQVSCALRKLGYRPHVMQVTLNGAAMVARLKKADPVMVFNLVESLDRSDRLMFIPPAILESAGIPFTGSPSHALYCTTNKPLSKTMMHQAGIPTPPWQTCREIRDKGFRMRLPVILKPVADDASRGIDDSAVIWQKSELLRRVGQLGSDALLHWFVEEYIDGRELNVSVLNGICGPDLLPVAEIHFTNFPRGKPKIVNYKAKWDEDAFEFGNTPRCFDFPSSDAPLLTKMKRLCMQCWELFGLAGYARVDFRVDGKNRPWVLEVNANPCISPDAGFVAAVEKAGMSYEQMIRRIVLAAQKKSR